jgi:hypothetical protein
VEGAVVFDLGKPHLVVAIVEAAELPFVLDHEVEEVVLIGVGGGEVVVMLAAEGFEFGGIFAAGESGFGVDTGLDGVGGGGSLAIGGAGAGGFFGADAVGGNLNICFVGTDESPPFARTCATRYCKIFSLLLPSST